MTTKQLIEDVRLITMNNLELIRKKISFLNEDQKSWKINQSSWSINEIFAHMNDYAKFYHSTFLERIEKTRFREPNSIFMSSFKVIISSF